MPLFSNRCKPFWWAGLTGITVLSTILFFQVVSQTSIDGLIRGDTKDYLAYAFNLKTYLITHDPQQLTSILLVQ